MTFSQILALVLQAFLTRNTAFAITIGKNHYMVAITAGTTPHGMQWFQVFNVVGMILAGQPGTFESGIFSVTISDLVPASASSPAIAPKV